MAKEAKGAREEGWIDVVEAGRILGCSSERARKLCEDRVIPSLRFSVGAPWRIREADLRQWIDDQLRAKVRPVKRKAGSDG